MITKIYNDPDVFKIDVPLPDNPLRNLNCYVISSNGKSLIIDTGFSRPECMKALIEGLKELGIDLKKTDMFLTHLHSDHTGLVPVIMRECGGAIYMGRVDHDYLAYTLKEDSWRAADNTFRHEGFTDEQLSWLRTGNPARTYSIKEDFPAKAMEDGEQIRLGEYSFRCVLTPGHTPGHMCLYEPDKKLLFSGDHILFDITPNITSWTGVEDSLGAYLDSLVKIRSFDIKTALPAHRNASVDVYERIRQLFEHHLARLEETLDAAEKFPDSHATKIGSCLKWSMRGKKWDEFPLSQRWFAVGEAIAHLDYLTKRGLIAKTEGRTNGYSLTTATAEEAKESLREMWTIYSK